MSEIKQSAQRHRQSQRRIFMTTKNAQQGANGHSANADIYARKIQDWAESSECFNKSREEMIRHQAAIIDQAIQRALDSETAGLKRDVEELREALRQANTELDELQGILIAHKYHGVLLGIKEFQLQIQHHLSGRERT